MFGHERILEFPRRLCVQIKGGIKLHQSVEEKAVDKSLIMQRTNTEQGSASWEDHLLDLWIEFSFQTNPQKGIVPVIIRVSKLQNVLFSFLFFGFEFECRRKAVNAEQWDKSLAWE